MFLNHVKSVQFSIWKTTFQGHKSIFRSEFNNKDERENPEPEGETWTCVNRTPCVTTTSLNYCSSPVLLAVPSQFLL